MAQYPYLCDCDNDESVVCWDLHRPRPHAFTRYCDDCVDEIRTARRSRLPDPDWYGGTAIEHPPSRHFRPPPRHRIPLEQELWTPESGEDPPVWGDLDEPEAEHEDEPEDENSSSSDGTALQFYDASGGQSSSSGNTERQYWTVQEHRYDYDEFYDSDDQELEPFLQTDNSMMYVGASNQYINEDEFEWHEAETPDQPGRWLRRDQYVGVGLGGEDDQDDEEDLFAVAIDRNRRHLEQFRFG